MRGLPETWESYQRPGYLGGWMGGASRDDGAITALDGDGAPFVRVENWANLPDVDWVGPVDDKTARPGQRLPKGLMMCRYLRPRGAVLGRRRAIL